MVCAALLPAGIRFYSLGRQPLLRAVSRCDGTTFSPFRFLLPNVSKAAPCLNAFWPPRPAATSSCAGYENFAVHGGDLGATISPEIVRVAPDRVIGVHVSGALASRARSSTRRGMR